MKINYLGLLFGLLLIFGVFGPWLSKGYEPYGGVNLKTGKLELNYHLVYNLSPLYATKIMDGVLVERAWFVSVGLSISAALIIFTSILFLIRFNKIQYNFISYVFSFIGFSMFFLSIGRGQAIGVVTKLGWGFFVSFLSAFFSFIFYVHELLKNPSI